MASSYGGGLSTGSKLSTILTDKPELIQQLALCLDREMRFVPNWKHLARKMLVDEDVIKRLEQHSDYSPTIRLFDHLEVTQPDLTIKTLRKALSEIRRNDLCLLTTEAVKSEITSQPGEVSPALLNKFLETVHAGSLAIGKVTRKINGWLG
ncbi:hypothetical protein OS493_027984 [Desmophyllum pertusum]|uniref:Death domain-containing protein n=1 Tax=Desmophyllum pertusum TaxID=174260 RepID=A0A9X0CF94_9CNID|nr:hypothetical protein OS493_027984 [Desmophyllum pertusum]